jgi:hypothetical protein
MNHSLVDECEFLFSVLPFADCDLSEEYYSSSKTGHQRGNFGLEKQTTEDDLRSENTLLNAEVYTLCDIIELQRVWYEKQINEVKMKRSHRLSFWESRSAREREDELRRIKLDFENEKNELENKLDEALRAVKLSFFQARNMDDRIYDFTQNYRSTLQRMKTRIQELDQELKLSKKKNFGLRTDVLFLLQNSLVPVFLFSYFILVLILKRARVQKKIENKPANGCG